MIRDCVATVAWYNHSQVPRKAIEIVYCNSTCSLHCAVECGRVDNEKSWKIVSDARVLFYERKSANMESWIDCTKMMKLSFVCLFRFRFFLCVLSHESISFCSQTRGISTQVQSTDVGTNFYLMHWNGIDCWLNLEKIFYLLLILSVRSKQISMQRLIDVKTINKIYFWRVVMRDDSHVPWASYRPLSISE